VPEFTNPAFLFLLLLTPPLFVWWLRRQRASLRFSDTRSFAGLPVGRARRSRVVTALLRSIALISVIAALAGPRLPDLKTRIPTESVAIMIVMDASGSMEQESFVWQDGRPPISRREAANRAFRLFVAGGDAPDGAHFDGRSTERGVDAIGLVVFSNWPHPLCPPTLNHSVLLHILEGYRKGPIRDEGSNIGDAIAEGLYRLEKAAPARKVLILISDGEHNFDHVDPYGRPLMPEETAQWAANLGVPIYVIDPGGEPPPDATQSEIVQRQGGRRVNQAIADLTGSRVFTANNGNELLSVCKKIDELERQPILSHSYRRYREYYPWLAGWALAVAIMVVVMEQTRWRGIP
jgi:Ca-activated chloride channel homolog